MLLNAVIHELRFVVEGVAHATVGDEIKFSKFHRYNGVKHVISDYATTTKGVLECIYHCHDSIITIHGLRKQISTESTIIGTSHLVAAYV